MMLAFCILGPNDIVQADCWILDVSIRLLNAFLNLYFTCSYWNPIDS